MIHNMKNLMHLVKKVKDLAKEYFNMIGKDRELLINFANKIEDVDPDV